MPASPSRPDSSVLSSYERRQGPFEPRAELVAKLARQLSQQTTPRLHLLCMMVGAGAAAFLISAALLWSQAAVFTTMMVRYAAAALGGYLTFLLLIRAWISLHDSPTTDSILDHVNPLDAWTSGQRRRTCPRFVPIRATAAAGRGSISMES